MVRERKVKYTKIKVKGWKGRGKRKGRSTK
jgi:hypothetical protein